MYLVDIWRRQASSDKWIEAWCDLVCYWKPVFWAEERGQIISGVGPFLEQRAIERAAWTAREQFSTHRGDKAVRAQSMRGRMAMSGLHVLENAPFLAELKAELLAFPAGRHDDQCLAEGTLITMADGSHRAIEDVVAGDWVATPLGPCSVEASAVTNESAPVFRVRTAAGHELVATGNHQVYVEKKGFVRVDELGIMDQITLEPLCSADHPRQKSSNIEIIDTGAIQTDHGRHIGDISMPPSRVVAFFIDICGKMLSVPFQRVTKSITGMATGTTIRSIISSALRRLSIVRAIQWLANPLSVKRNIWTPFATTLQNGTAALMGAHGIQIMAAKVGLGGLQSPRLALHAAPFSKRNLSAPNFALVDVSNAELAQAPRNAGDMSQMAKLSNANVAIVTSGQNGRKSPRIAQKHAGCVIAVEALSKRVKVRNLTVNRVHVYYANGMLTHNCDALGLIGQLFDRVSAGVTPIARKERRGISDSYRAIQDDIKDDRFLTL
jgi:hypothetical protein